jgi:CheY-like chemotaxis protein
MTEGKYRIWVVDDDAISNFVTVRHLKQFKTLSTIHDFINPQEALSFLQKSEDGTLPDFILLDINMPNLDGWTFLDKMNELEVLFPKVFMLTSSIYPEDYEKSQKYGLVKGFIVKPLDRIKIQTELNID